MTVEIGKPAPDFELIEAQSKQKIKLSDFRGEKNVLLIFYPFAFSGMCQGEFCEMRDANPDIPDSEDLEVFGISVDTHYTLKVWQDQEGLPGRFLSDFWPHGDVAKAYDAFIEPGGCATRATFLIDKDGIVQWMENVGPLQARDQNGWREALASVASPSATH